MKKVLKKHILFCMFITIMCILISTKVEAINWGKGPGGTGNVFNRYWDGTKIDITSINKDDEIKIHKYLYRRYGQIICLQEKQDTLWDTYTYKVSAKIRFTGKTAQFIRANGNVNANKTYTNDNALKLRYLLTRTYDPEHVFAYVEGIGDDNKIEPNSTKVNLNDRIQGTIWGSQIYKGWYNSGKGKEQIGEEFAPSTSSDYTNRQNVTQMVSEVNSYAQNYKEDPFEKKNTTVNITVSQESGYEGGVKLGPFKFSYGTNIESIRLYNANGNAISTSNFKIRYLPKNADKYQDISVQTIINNNNQILSDRAFYIHVKKGITPTQLVIKRDITLDDYDVEALFLSAGDVQKMMVYQRVAPTNQELTWNFNVKYGNIKITKKGNKNGTTMNMSGVKFTVYIGSTSLGEYTTGSDGTVTIKNLLPGTYKVKETGITNTGAGQANYGFTNEGHTKSGITVTADNTATVEFTNTYQLGKVVVHKQKKIGDTLSDMSGVEFTLYKGSAAVAVGTTGTDGKITFNDIPAGSDYQVKETGITNNLEGQANYGFVVESHTANVTVKANATTTVPTFVNTYRLGSMVITKKDKASQKLMPNVGFTLKMTSGQKSGQYVGINSSGHATYSYSPQTLMTNASGQITIYYMWEGTYELIETVNPYPGYDSVPKTITSNGTISGNNAQAKVEVINEKKFINITGTVWEETAADEGKETLRNNLMDSGERKVQGIKVSLLKGSNILQEKITDVNGNYTFTGALIDDVVNNRLSIQYEYNGMKYKSIPIVNNTNGSKASDNADYRQTIDATFNTITANSGIQYSMANHTSTVTYVSEVAGYSNNYYAQEKFHVLATTSGVYDLKSGYNPNDINQSQIVVNFGITKKEQPDLSVVKDVQSAKVSIAGLDYLYNYADRFTNIQKNGDGHEMEPLAKFETGTYSKMTYTRPLYASDIFSSSTTTGVNPVEVRVIYRIQIKNKATTLANRVNQIVDYYDNRYELENVGTQIDAKGNVTQSLTWQASQTIGNYNSITIDTTTLGILSSQSTKDIYLTFKVKYDYLATLINNTNPSGLENVAEITSYTTYYNNTGTTVYAGIDENSQPGNAIPGNISTYEDDTDRAPALQLTIQNPRKTTGTVFEDKTTDEFKEGEVRQGDGIYKTGEDKTIGNVKVRLLKESDKTIANIYNSTTKTWEPAEKTTDANGNYEISGYIPGDYIIEYEWGDNTYRVQDYKSTIVNKDIYEGNLTNPEWYKNNDVRYSDAVDDYSQRQAIDSEIPEISIGVKEKLDKTYDSTPEAGEYINKISAFTPKLSVGIEFDINDPTKPHEISNVDFGIAKRAQQKLKLTKRLDTVKLTLANGTILVNAHVVEDTNGELKLETEQKYATYIPDSPNGLASGQLRIESDLEILQGATIEIKYAYFAENRSELEYLTEEFYNYGSQVLSTQNDNDKVKLQAKEIIDYVDNNVAISLEHEQEAGGNKWTKVDDTKTRQLLGEDGTVLATIYSNFSTVYTNLNNVLTTDKLDGTDILPGQKAQINLTTYRVLGQSLDGFHAENEAEIIRVGKNGGSSLVTIPGNYDPSKEPQVHEEDDDESEYVSIVVPFGLKVDYVSYIIWATIGLAIIIVGVVLIKKYVLK